MREKQTQLVTENSESVICVYEKFSDTKHAAIVPRHLAVLLLCASGEMRYTRGAVDSFFFGIQAELNPHFDAFWRHCEDAGK